MIREMVRALHLHKGGWSEKRRVLVVPNAAAPLILRADWYDDWLLVHDRYRGRVFLAGCDDPWVALPRRPTADIWEAELGVKAEGLVVEVMMMEER